MKRTNCAYCNQPITKLSREHVIQNALGGMYESTDICCPECNNYISRTIDAPFTTMFNPVIGGIDNMVKSRHSAPPSYKGNVTYNDKQYKADVKNGKIVGCPELSQEIRGDATKLGLKADSFDFNLDNTYFRNGMAKIAFNFALARGVDLRHLSSGLAIDRDKETIKSIEFKYPLIPFYPLTTVDHYLELNGAPQLHHAMVLFSQHNTLWCYIDLFNTFQYYVLLSENLPTDTNIYANYAQRLQRDKLPEIEIGRMKDIFIYAQQYKVEPCDDIEEFIRRIHQAVSQRPARGTLSEIVLKKLMGIDMFSMLKGLPTDLAMETLNNMNMFLCNCDPEDNFFDEEDAPERIEYGTIREEVYRTVFADKDGNILSYPATLADRIEQNDGPLRNYTAQKFERLNQLLYRKTK